MAILDLAAVILDLSVRLLLSLVWHVKFVFGWLVCVVYSHLFLSKKNSHLKVIGCSSLRGGGGELGTNKNLDLWLQLVCTKLKLKHAI